MKAYLKIAGIFFLLFSGNLFLNGQNRNKLTIDRIFSGHFRSESLGDIRWMKTYDGFTQRRSSSGGSEIHLFNINKNEWQVLVGSNELIPTGHSKPLRIAGFSWSEDESRLLIFTNTKRVWRRNTRGDYWVFDMKEKTLKQLGKSLPESSLMFAKFAPDNLKVAYVSNSNIYVEDLKTGSISQLTFDGTGDIINGTFDWAYEEEFDCRDGFRWSGDGEKIAFWQIDATGIKDFILINNTDSLYSYVTPVQYPKVGEDPSSAKIGVVSIEDKKVVWLKIPGDTKQHYLPRMQWIPEQDRLLVRQLNRKQNHLKIYKCSAFDGGAEIIYEEKDDAWIEIFGVDITMKGLHEDLNIVDKGEAFIFLSEKDGWRHLYKVGIDEKKELLLTDGEYDVATYYHFDQDADVIYFNASPDNATQRYLYRMSLNETRSIEKTTPGQFSGVNNYDFAPNGKYAIHTHSNANTPAVTSLIKVKTHKPLYPLVRNKDYKSQLATYDLPKVEFFQITTGDGIEMDGRMIKPESFDPSKKYPVIFYVYGEPWGQTAVDSWVGLWQLYLAQQGYVVITMDNRGTPSIKGRTWRKSIYRKIGVINSRDQAMAAKEILKWSFIDNDRIAVYGWSGGGSMTLNLLFRYPEIYKTGVAGAAVANQLYYDNIYQERYMGLPWENMEDFIEGSPITHAKNLQGNLLIVHGTGDDNVHYQNTEALINELVVHNKMFDLMVYPNVTHSLSTGKGSVLHYYTLLYNYISEHTPPGGIE
ncbi:MAG: S9 family peptidase [Cytophagales bacterium]|nr:S9 family peptidase [Cytophagales bacterium]